MEEAAAIFALAIVNSSPVLQEQFRGQAVQNPQAGADFLGPYFVAAMRTIQRQKAQYKL